jgi:hypothetical protein
LHRNWTVKDWKSIVVRWVSILSSFSRSKKSSMICQRKVR